jgi:hypothetical protein
MELVPLFVLVVLGGFAMSELRGLAANQILPRRRAPAKPQTPRERSSIQRPCTSCP